MVARQWIPQTMGDCVWLWYEFETKVRAVEFILALSGVYYKYETRLSQAVLDDWADVGYSEHHAWL